MNHCEKYFGKLKMVLSKKKKKKKRKKGFTRFLLLNLKVVNK